MKTILLAVAILVLSINATAAQPFPEGKVVTSHKPILCTHFNNTIEALESEEYNEKIVAVGNSDIATPDGSKVKTIIFFNAKNGSYSIVEVFESQMACSVSTGKGMEFHLPPKHNKTSGQRINYAIPHPINFVVQ